jgi:RNA recognition motif-containing protein
MSRADYSLGKRQRETEKARKSQEKAARRMRRRAEGPGEPELVTMEEIVGTLPTVEQAMEALENRAANPRSASAIPCRLFVGGVSWNTTEEDLRQAFSKFGPVADAAIVKDRDTGQSRGFAFVTMADRKDAGRAIDGLNGSELDGRRLVVNVATARTGGR